MFKPAESQENFSSSFPKTDDDLDSLWEKAKAVEMSEEEQDEQRILHVFANVHLSDPRVTIDTARAAHTLVQSSESDIAA